MNMHLTNGTTTDITDELQESTVNHVIAHFTVNLTERIPQMAMDWKNLSFQSFAVLLDCLNYQYFLLVIWLKD